MGKTFSIKEAINFGWTSLKEKPKFWILAFLIIAVSSGATSGLSSSLSEDAAYKQKYEELLEETKSTRDEVNAVTGMDGRPRDIQLENTTTPPTSVVTPSKEVKDIGVGGMVLLGSFATLAVIVGVCIAILMSVVTNFISMGSVKLVLDKVRGNELKYETLLTMVDINLSLKALGASFLYGLMVFFGFIFFIIPGIYLAVKYSYFYYGIVDKKLGIMDSFKYSAMITTGAKFKIFQFELVAIFLCIIGFMMFLVGAFFAWIVVFLASAYVYEKLRLQSEVKEQIVTPAAQ